MRLHAVRLLSILLTAAFACTGSKGPEGPAGPAGQQGPEGAQGATGQDGPITAPPALSGLSPDWGSAATMVTLSGENFSDTAADNRVTFNGWPAEIVSASTTELVVRPNVAVEDEMSVVVNVEVANQVSNGLFFDLVPSGTARAVALTMPTAPTGVVGVGTDRYVAAGSASSPMSGLYQVDSSGVATRVVAARSLDNPGPGPAQLFDSPIAVATDGTDVYYTTAFGSLRRYEVASGAVEELLGPALGGAEFPARTGLALDTAGNIYILDRNGAGDSVSAVSRLSTDGTLTQIAVLGAGGYGLASDGTDLFATVGGHVAKIADPAGTPVLTATHGSGTGTALGVTVDGTDVIVSYDDGTLGSVDTSTPGAIATWGDGGGYLYGAQGLWASGGDLYLAQADGSAVREIADGQNDAVIVSAGARIAFGTARSGQTWYFATVGSALFDDRLGDAPAAPDGAVLQVNADGSSRVLAGGVLPVDVLVTGADELTVSDCLASRIFTVTPSSGASADVLTSGDGLGCPTGMVENAGGALFFAEAHIGSDTPGSISKLGSGGTLTADFITGLPPDTIYLERIGDALYTAGVGVDGGSGIWTADSTSSGAASRLAADSATSGATALAVGPGDRIFMHRFGLGDLLEIDSATGQMSPVGSSLLPELGSLGQGSGSIAFSLGFRADGTIVLADAGQGVMIAVAP